MRRLAVPVVLLAWWFVMSAGTHRPASTVGPFQTESDCQAVRSWLVQNSWNPVASRCWWDGKP